MLSKRINKYLVSLLGVLCIAMLTMSIAFFTIRNSAPLRADTQYLVVEKVFVPDADSLTDPSAIRHVGESGQTIGEGDFVIMNTSQHQYLDEQNQAYTGREAILINFPGTATSKGIPTVSIWYNNNLIKTNRITEVDDEEGQPTGTSTFSQYLFALTLGEYEAASLDKSYLTLYASDPELGNMTEAQRQALAQRTYEGQYRVSLRYFDVNEGEKEESISFYITTQKTYNVVNENPTLSDTEKVDALFDSTNSKLNTYYQMTAGTHYFNFNNNETTYYSTQQQNFILGRTNPDNTYYPTLYYNPKKFDISFTRTIYNYRETTTLSFDVYLTSRDGITTEVGYLNVETYTTENPTNIIRRTYEVERGASGFELKLQFDQVGEYIITKTPKLEVGLSGNRVSFVTPASNIITANEEYLTPMTLIINGYIANYSNSSTTKAPLYNDTYSYNTMDTTGLNTASDVVYAHDFLTNSTDEYISATPRTRAETVYTADMTFNNSNLVTNNSTEIITMANLKSRIMAAYPTATDSNAYSYFFNFINTTNFIKTSYSNTVSAGNMIYTVSPSTNLAPVSFDFYGTLYTGTSTNYASWYAYRDTSGNVSVNRYTRGLQFENAGDYVVYLTYQNVIFSTNQQTGSRQFQYMHQVFSFSITNATPTISVLAQDNAASPTISSSETAEQLGNDAYTNKFVYTTWEVEGPFDASIYCTYNVHSWNAGENDAPIVSNAPLNGLVYQTGNGTKVKVSTANTTLLYGSRKTVGGTAGLDGYYQIQVFKSNNTKAFVNYTFSIDTAPIDGIKTLQVMGKQLARENGSTEPIVLSELNYNNFDAFNLITNLSFGFTWNDKLSGATITAQYIYASITKYSNYDLIKAITGRDDATETDAQNALYNMAAGGNVYMPTNATLGVFTPAMIYNKIKTDTYEDIISPLADSQIINTPQLAFLLLRDAAGNTAIYATMLDNTDTQILQVEQQSSYVNVITKDTSFYWGTHKSISATASTADRTDDPNLVRDIYDFVSSYDPLNNTFTWNIKDKAYVSSAALTKAFYDMNITSTRSLNLPLDHVQISAEDDQNEFCEPDTQNGNAVNWYAVITVDPGATADDPYTTRVKIDGSAQSSNIHTLASGEFRYEIFVWDEAQNSNSGGLSIEVNLDKTLGSMRSYYDFDGSDLVFNRNSQKGEITDRQYVGNTYSTDRRYVSFSWTEPSSEFSIKSITLDFYPLACNTQSTNYPYGDTPIHIELYNATNGYEYVYEYGSIYKINKTNASGTVTTYYQTDILKKLPYRVEFDSAASEAGKYVITRTYMMKDSHDENITADLEGDSEVKVYTYYVDRNPILDTGEYTYGDIKMQFGYNRGDYEKYPDYPVNGQIIFDNYGILNNTEGFDRLSLNTTNISASTPTNIITQSNVLPASVNMSHWQDANYSVYDKYYTDPQEACDNILSVLNTYKNATRVQVAVQFFAKTPTTQYALTNQTFYSTKTPATEIVDPALKNLYSRSLSELQYAFKEIGRYRVILFDLSNFDGLLSGNAYTDFQKVAINISNDANSKNTLYPNCSIVSFELTGQAPQFNYQVGIDSYASTDSNQYEALTNENKARISWSDPSNEFSAQVAYNDISITMTTIPKGNNPSTTVIVPPEYRQYFTLSTRTQRGIFADPVELTSSDTVRQSLVDEGYTCISLDTAMIDSILKSGLGSLSDYIREQTALPTDPVTYAPYFLYVNTQALLNTIINNGLSTTNLSQIEFYKVRKTDAEKLYDYYLLLPKSEIEDASKNATKLADTRFVVNVHYIAKNSTDYLVNGSDTYYATTKELYIDNTAPYYNLIDLINNDAYINSLGDSFKKSLITNIDNPDSTFLKSYAFAVNPGYKIEYRNKYESSTYFYYRKIDNYTGAKDEQVVIEADSRYPSAPTFDKNSSDFVRGTYSGLSNMVATVFNETGYYDIIEQDQAGNMRVYTIFVSDESFRLSATNGTDIINLDNTNIRGKEYNSEKQTLSNNIGFTITSLVSEDKWIHIKLTNEMNPLDYLEYYYVPSDALSDVTFENVNSEMSQIIADINQFILDTAIKYQDQFGSRISMSITNRLNMNNSYSFYINTQGRMLINSEEDFLSLITTNPQVGQFNIRMPNTTNIASTKLSNLTVFMIESDRNTIQVQYDANYVPLPTTQAEFESDKSINEGYAFTLANNIVYKFEFIDNFGRKATYSYPIDSSLIKRLEYTGERMEYTYNGTTYTYTSNDVELIYQATGLNVSVVITDLENNTIVYQKLESELFDTDNPLFTYTRDSLASNIITVRFNAIRGLHHHVHIEINSGTDTITPFDFVIYTHLPEIILSDTSGSPIQNNITSKEVMITWVDVEAEFHPYVELVYPDGTIERIQSGFSVADEGDYIVRCVNDIGICNNGKVEFTIKEYIVSIYGVYQQTSDGNTVQLSAFTDNYLYTTPQGEMSISQYVFLSNDTNWDRNIIIYCNEDKDLHYEIVETYGNTRIYRVYGEYLYHIEIYFAVTRIPSLYVGNYTNFRINGNSTLRSSEFQTAATTITWQTSYTDNSATGRTYTYPKFFILDLTYNGTFVGSYTSGTINLTNSGIYTITIHDPVGQKQTFGSGSNSVSTSFELTILTNVIYYVNDNAAIPYATYSDAVDFYVPSIAYYDYAPRVTFYRNNAEYAITPNADGHYIFTTPGAYKAVMSSSIESVIGSKPEAQLNAVYQFIIVSPNEAISSYDFTPMSGYEIIEVLRLDSDTDITEEIREANQTNTITSLHIDADNYGVGKYQITVRVAANGYNPSQTYTYSIWINNETVNITPSREWGSSSTSAFSITLNIASVYERIGECQISINGQTVLAINDSNKDRVDPYVINSATDQGDYIVQLVSASGKVLQSYRMTINEPFNTAAIILIVAACVVVIGLVILFIILRHRVKVR